MTSSLTRMKKWSLTVSENGQGLEDRRGVAYQDPAYWSHFTVKQTYDKLKPKRTFTPHVSNHNSSSDNWHADIAIDGPQSTRHGWEWYEMGFFTY